ncbi:MAG: hypothetical protein KIT25_02135 [Enhydrobacter sp.]|nr:MAG: hypothetical protein KIT25_02135 [Enhydrobacter sp.]
MRHILVGTTMLVFALMVTFGAASVLQFNAIAHANKSAEPFVIEAATEPMKPARERAAPTLRSRDHVQFVRVSG